PTGGGAARRRAAHARRPGVRPDHPCPHRRPEAARALRAGRRRAPRRHRGRRADRGRRPRRAAHRPRLGRCRRPAPRGAPAHRPTPPERPMRFLAPGWLALLSAVAALIVAYLVVQRRRSRYAVRFAALPLLERVMPREPGWRRHVPAIAFLLTVTALVLAMARPVLEVQVPRERATIVVAVDVSLSMGARDVAPSRIEAAVGAARRFVAELPEAFPVGLVLFDGRSSVPVPPTPDRAAVTRAFDRISLGSGTAIGDAVLA